MSGVASLAEDLRGQALQVGDPVKITVLLEGRSEAGTDSWKLVTPAGQAWLNTGSLTLAASSVRVLPAEGDATKLELSGIVTVPGPLNVTAFSVQKEGGEPVSVAAANLAAQSTAPQLSEQEQKELPWVLPPVPFGGWNYILIGLLCALFLGALSALLRWVWQRYGRKHLRQLDHREQALANLQDLQPYARAAGIKQEEWKKFSFGLASTLRRYSDANFHVRTPDRTDSEFLAHLREKGVAAEHVATVAKILETIDAVRYGRQELLPGTVGELLQDSRRFIKDSFHPEEKEAKK